MELNGIEWNWEIVTIRTPCLCSCEVVFLWQHCRKKLKKTDGWLYRILMHSQCCLITLPSRWSPHRIFFGAAKFPNVLSNESHWKPLKAICQLRTSKSSFTSWQIHQGMLKLSKCINFAMHFHALPYTVQELRPDFQALPLGGICASKRSWVVLGFVLGFGMNIWICVNVCENVWMWVNVYFFLLH